MPEEDEGSVVGDSWGVNLGMLMICVNEHWDTHGIHYLPASSVVTWICCLVL
jgi:hypothetical protein